jgi:hypothetical protein
MHGLTGGDWKRAVISGNRASPRPSQPEMQVLSSLVVGFSGAGLVAAAPA